MTNAGLGPSRLQKGSVPGKGDPSAAPFAMGASGQPATSGSDWSGKSRVGGALPPAAPVLLGVDQLAQPAAGSAVASFKEGGSLPAAVASLGKQDVGPPPASGKAGPRAVVADPERLTRWRHPDEPPRRASTSARSGHLSVAEANAQSGLIGGGAFSRLNESLGQFRKSAIGRNSSGLASQLASREFAQPPHATGSQSGAGAMGRASSRSGAYGELDADEMDWEDEDEDIPMVPSHQPFAQNVNDLHLAGFSVL